MRFRTRKRKGGTVHDAVETAQMAIETQLDGMSPLNKKDLVPLFEQYKQISAYALKKGVESQISAFLGIFLNTLQCRLSKVKQPGDSCIYDLFVELTAKDLADSIRMRNALETEDFKFGGESPVCKKEDVVPLIDQWIEKKIAWIQSQSGILPEDTPLNRFRDDYLDYVQTPKDVHPFGVFQIMAGYAILDMLLMESPEKDPTQSWSKAREELSRRLTHLQSERDLMDYTQSMLDDAMRSIEKTERELSAELENPYSVSMDLTPSVKTVSFGLLPPSRSGPPMPMSAPLSGPLSGPKSGPLSKVLPPLPPSINRLRAMKSDIQLDLSGRVNTVLSLLRPLIFSQLTSGGEVFQYDYAHEIFHRHFSMTYTKDGKEVKVSQYIDGLELLLQKLMTIVQKEKTKRTLTILEQDLYPKIQEIVYAIFWSVYRTLNPKAEQKYAMPILGPMDPTILQGFKGQLDTAFVPLLSKILDYLYRLDPSISGTSASGKPLEPTLEPSSPSTPIIETERTSARTSVRTPVRVPRVTSPVPSRTPSRAPSQGPSGEVYGRGHGRGSGRVTGRGYGKGPLMRQGKGEKS